ncbi:MAG: type II toxin-antitoxin system VapC family toxin [Candidatus Kariarchaeaceae archaeon]
MLIFTDQIILFDTNFLLPFPKNINLEKELDRVFPGGKIIILNFILDELKGLAKEKGSIGRSAKLGLQLAHKWTNIVLDAEGPTVDDRLVAAAQTLNAIIATNDKDLRKKAKQKGIPVIFVKGHSHFEYDGQI